jgi:Holliday junction resolvase RusA-like endonuclease
MRHTQSDLDRMGLELIPGTSDQYRRKKTVLQPREIKAAAIAIDNTKVLRTVKLTLFGEPMPKQSVRSFATGAKSDKGKFIISHYQPQEMSDRVKDYQFQIRKQLPPDFKMFEEQVHITQMHFIFPPLKAFHKIKGRMDDIYQGKIIYKTTKPDLPDNLKKLVNDSMSGVVFKDDSIIVSEDNVKKYYGVGGAIIIQMEGY